MKILVVEDSRMTQVLLQRALTKWGYEVKCVSNIDDATEFLKSEPVYFVITDWIMPGGTGPMLCRRIRSMEDSTYIYIILMTTLDGSSSMVEGMESGADDFIRKPIQLEEMRVRIRAGERILKLEENLQKRNKKLIDAQNIINQDIKLASDMQRGILPDLPSRIFNSSADGLFCPSAQVSGDIFNFFRLDEGYIGFYSIDVAGHGVAAAMLSFALSRMLTPELNNNSLLKVKLPGESAYKVKQPTSLVLEELNTQFQTDSNNSLYFTMIYGVLNVETMRLDLCLAGHPLPIFLPVNGPAEFLGDGGFPVGITSLAVYESLDIQCASGDRLYIYSDGISECPRADGEMYSPERFLTFIEEHRELAIDKFLKQLDENLRLWQGGDEFEDDVSLLVLEI